MKKRSLYCHLLLYVGVVFVVVDNSSLNLDNQLSITVAFYDSDSILGIL